MSTFVLAILALELMILVHELGHLLVAKRVGIAVSASTRSGRPRRRRSATAYTRSAGRTPPSHGCGHAASIANRTPAAIPASHTGRYPARSTMR